MNRRASTAQSNKGRKEGRKEGAFCVAAPPANDSRMTETESRSSSTETEISQAREKEPSSNEFV